MADVCDRAPFTLDVCAKAFFRERPAAVPVRRTLISRFAGDRTSNIILYKTYNIILIWLHAAELGIRESPVYYIILQSAGLLSVDTRILLLYIIILYVLSANGSRGPMTDRRYCVQLLGGESHLRGKVYTYK